MHKQRCAWWRSLILDQWSSIGLMVVMPSDFPFVEVPQGALKILGIKDENTRVYRREGSQEEIGPWYDKILEIAGPAISPGGVCMYAKVSRAAVYLAINEGRLTTFGFHVLTESKGIWVLS